MGSTRPGREACWRCCGSETLVFAIHTIARRNDGIGDTGIALKLTGKDHKSFEVTKTYILEFLDHPTLIGFLTASREQ